MKKIFILTFLSALLCSPTFAQTEEQSVPKDSIVEDQIVDQSEYVTEEGPAENYAEEAEVTANDSTITDVDTYSNDATETLMDEKNVTEAYTPSSTGPNRKWHRQIYLQLGFMADNPNAGAAIRYGLSTQWGFGFRIKRRLNNTFALTNDWGYRSTTFNIKQENSKIVPDLKQHRTEKIDFHSITTALHLRINVGRRGNYVGNFLDLGGYGGYALVTRHLTWDKLEGSPANTTKVVEKGLDYVNRLDYGLSGRIGMNHWSLFSRYRLSDMFKDNKYPEMSKLVIGVDFAF